MSDQILVIDDDVDTTALVRLVLEHEGFQVLTAHSGVEALRVLYQHRPDAVLLDVMMPDIDGYEACQRIRQVANLPILMLTAKTQEEDAVRGLTVGADDYIRKPFHPKELVARVRAALRRARTPPVEDHGLLTFAEGALTIDPNAQKVLVNGQEVTLTATEFRLLLLLARNAGRVMSNSILAGELSEHEKANTQGIRWFIWKLRRKIETNPEDPQYIRTVHGVGYRFEV